MTRRRGAGVAGGVDPYVPGHGDSRFGVSHYALALDYKVTTNHLSAVAVLQVVLAQETSEIALDLYGLHVAKVLVDGRAPARFAHRGSRLVVTLSRPGAAGAELEVRVSYAGKPRPMPGIDGRAGWEELTDGVLVGSQPHGAPSWYPCNDRPDDKATYRIQLTVASGYHVTANGRLAQFQPKGGRTTWVYAQDEPMASYLSSVQIGRYICDVIVDDDNGPAVEIIRPRRIRIAGSAFARLAEMVSFFTGVYGEYPFPVYRCVITDDDLEIPLEAQSLASFGANHVPATWENERLVAHELAHQWFGNSLTATAWRDIWLHEGFACYSEWLWSEQIGRSSVQDQARTHWEKLSRLPADLVVGDPGPEDMFDDRIYKRGALTLHAIRCALGDAAFGQMIRAWTADNAYGGVSTEGFTEHIQRFTQRPVGHLMDRWLHAKPLPPLPIANRVGSPVRLAASPRPGSA